MATGIDRLKIKSTIIFNEIQSAYPIGDIECRFYADGELTSPDDVIGLYRIGWKEMNEFLAVKDIKNSKTDEFGERRVVFTGAEFRDKVVGGGQSAAYQFCYFSFVDSVYHFQESSTSFRFSLPTIADTSNMLSDTSVINKNNNNSVSNRLSAEPELIQRQTLDSRNGSKARYQTNPRDERYESNAKCVNEICQQRLRSVEWELACRESELNESRTRYAQQERVSMSQIDCLNAAVKLDRDKIGKLETELRSRSANDDQMKIMQSDLMQLIKTSEVKNSSLEQQLFGREQEINALRVKCSEQEMIIDELRTKLTVTHSELDKCRVVQSKESTAHETENKFLRDKLDELTLKCEKFKRVKECLQQEKIELNTVRTRLEVELQMTREAVQDWKRRTEKSDDAKLKIAAELRAKEMLMKKHIDEMKTSYYKSPNDIIIQARQQTSANVTIFVNEMSPEMKDYAANHSIRALKSCNDIRSIAISLSTAFDNKYGKCWHCFVGENIGHEPFSHAPNAYLSFAIDSLHIVLYKTSQTLEFSDVIRSAKTCKQVDNIHKNECIDPAFETFILTLILETMQKEFANYYELAGHLTSELHAKYGDRYGSNWLAIAGASDQFDSHYRMANRRYIEMQCGHLKIIVQQIDDMTKTLTRFSKIKNLKG